MRDQIRHHAALCLTAILAVSATLGAQSAAAATQSAAAATISPLPASDYTVRPACDEPEPGMAGCMALELIPRTAAARADTHPLGMTVERISSSGRSPTSGDFGLRPNDIHHAYRLPLSAESAQTIALVDAYDDPTIESDLRVYDETFHLPSCTEVNGCFKKVNQAGETGHLPEAEEGWALEISLDVEAAHATCQSCHILLVEASAPSYTDLAAAEETAGRLGATEISNSWGGPEEGQQPAQESATAFNQPGVVITASAGDDGYLNWDSEFGGEEHANFPASSPHVVAVGGTRLELSTDSSWAGESVWNGYGASGGGCSSVFTAPSWQQSLTDWSTVGCGHHRSVSDVSADADPYTGFAIYDTSTPSYCEGEHGVDWCPVGGTSLASPLIAGVYALAGGGHGVAYPARTLYEGERTTPGALHDITTGSNGECEADFTSEGLSGCTTAEEAGTSCGGSLSCLTGSGYDGPTGVGTPDGLAAFEPGGVAPAGGSSEDFGEEVAQEPVVEQTPQATSPPAAPPPEKPPASRHAPAPVLSGLTLIHRAIAADARALARLSTVTFTFSMSIPSTVRASLSRRIGRHGHTSWHNIPGQPSFNSHSGLNKDHLPAHGRLTPGIYRLTLTPTGGAARSILFQVT